MRFRPRVFELDLRDDWGELALRLAERRGLVVLDAPHGEPARTSWLAFDPVRGLAPPADLLALDGWLDCLRAEAGDAIPGAFEGGFMGALSYDLGVAGERRIEVAPDPWNSPRVVGGFYTDFVVRDARSARTWLVLNEHDLDGRGTLEARRAEILAALHTRRAPGALEPIGPLVRHTAPAEHRARVERARERIAAGDLYQVNLAHRLTRCLRGAPLDLFLRLRRVNPAPFMAFLDWDEALCAPGSAFARGALVSASPELLLDFDGTRALTRPIKGTSPRAADPQTDERLRAALLASAKDQAELAMIVDLERNDLGRCAELGSVRVPVFPRSESYTSVHHLSADVECSVRTGVGAVQLLAALFPGGSITGAPKLASMRVIAELEREGRGFFSGALGFVGLDGRALFNILIRTLVWRPLAAGEGEVSYHVGGGITWNSDPEAEERETLFKGAALAAALERETDAEL